MHHNKRHQRIGAVIMLFAIVIGGAFYFWPREAHRPLIFIDSVHAVEIEDDTVVRSAQGHARQTVGEFLATTGITLADGDYISVAHDAFLATVEKITITRAKKVRVIRGDSERFFEAYRGDSVRAVLDRESVDYDAGEDHVDPALGTVIDGDMDVRIIDVVTEEMKEVKDTPFEKVEKTDDTKEASFKEVTQKGAFGKKEIIYKITLHDGKEVARDVASERIIQKAINEVITVGTKEKEKAVHVGESHFGQASWYAYKGCDCAAHKWLPKGSRAKVTNTANGKSVIVTINDRGPFIEGRIIDLDKTAFEKIASIGAGVIDVKMEEVKD